MSIREIKAQYREYCKRMQENNAEIAIISFEEFKKAMKRFGGNKDV